MQSDLEMDAAAGAATDPAAILTRAIPHDRVHSGYLLTGASERARAAALAFVRALVCEAGTGLACEACTSCHQSGSGGTGGTDGPDTGLAPVELDGDGKRGPTYRHVADHASLFWVERGREDTRIKITQIRDLQSALRLRGFDQGRRAAVIDGAEWMNASAQNALLRILEEPPARTTLVLVAARPSAVLATIRSRCVRIRFPEPLEPSLRDPATPPAVAELVALLDDLRGRSVPQILDDALAYRGVRAEAAEAAAQLIDVAGRWLHERVGERIARGERPTPRELDAAKHLLQLRRELVQRNANPQMVAERLLFRTPGRGRLMWIDSHCHVTADRFDADRSAVLDRAFEAGVEALLSIGSGYGLEGNAHAIALADSDPRVFATVGVHPHEAARCDAEVERRLRGWLDHERVVAVGECGLDYHYMNAPREAQRRVFAAQVGLARECGLPVSIHVRSDDEQAYDELLEIWIAEGGRALEGVLHCYTGSRGFALRALDEGFSISFSGIVTFKSSHALREVARAVPLDRLLVETDAPFLAPEGRRGKRNEPAWVPLVGVALAAVHDVPVEALARATTHNARRLFRLPPDLRSPADSEPHRP